MRKRQPLEARVWGRICRSWYPATGRLRKLAKRRSARRERQVAAQEIAAARREPDE